MTELWRLSASEIASRVAKREISATEVTEQCLQRLQQVNPQINAVVQQMPDAALACAREVDDLIEAGEPAGLLAGVPVTIKVNIDQQGFANTNGIRIQQEHMPQQDSPVVTNLRNAGAIVVGKLLDEFVIDRDNERDRCVTRDVGDVHRPRVETAAGIDRGQHGNVEIPYHIDELAQVRGRGMHVVVLLIFTGAGRAWRLP